MTTRLLKTFGSSIVAAVMCGYPAFRVSMGFLTLSTSLCVGVAATAIAASLAATLTASSLVARRSFLSSRYAEGKSGPFYDDPKFLIRTGYDGSDSGRRLGWWVVLRGRRVATLDYLWWDSGGQFWHVYRLTITDAAATYVIQSGDLWCSERVQIESRFVPGYLVDGTLASYRAPNLMALRFAHVPDDVFDRPDFDYTTLELNTTGSEAT